MSCAGCLLRQVLKYDVPYSQSAMEGHVASDVDSKSGKHTSVKISDCQKLFICTRAAAIH